MVIDISNPDTMKGTFSFRSNRYAIFKLPINLVINKQSNARPSFKDAGKSA
jgi:CheY-specific phosphatase CheX